MKRCYRLLAFLLSAMVVAGSVQIPVTAAEYATGETAAEIFDEEIAQSIDEVAAEESDSAEKADGMDMEEENQESLLEEVSASINVTLDANGGCFCNEWDDVLGMYVENTEILNKVIPVGMAISAYPVNEQVDSVATFLGWSLERDGELVTQEQKEYVPVDNCILYAVWKYEDRADEDNSVGPAPEKMLEKETESELGEESESEPREDTELYEESESEPREESESRVELELSEEPESVFSEEPESEPEISGETEVPGDLENVETMKSDPDETSTKKAETKDSAADGFVESLESITHETEKMASENKNTSAEDLTDTNNDQTEKTNTSADTKELSEVADAEKSSVQENYSLKETSGTNNDDDGEWISYGTGRLTIDETYSGYCGRGIAITASWISENKPDRVSWEGDDSLTFSGTSIASPVDTGKENTWFVNVMVSSQSIAKEKVTAIVNGVRASTTIEFLANEQDTENQWSYVVGEIDEINNSSKEVVINKKTYKTSSLYTYEDANSAMNALANQSKVLVSFLDECIVHIRPLTEILEPVVEIYSTQGGIFWSEGKYNNDEELLNVRVKYISKQNAIFGNSVLKITHPIINIESIKISTSSELISFEKEGLFDSSKDFEFTYNDPKKIDYNTPLTDQVNVKMNNQKAPSATVEEVLFNAQVRIQGWGEIKCQDVILNVGNTDIETIQKEDNERNKKINDLSKELSDKLAGYDRNSIVVLDNELYNYFSKDQVAEIRDFLAVYMAEILEADKVGDLSCFSWMPSKAREKVKKKIFSKLGVNEKIQPTFKSGSATVTVEGLSLQGDIKSVVFEISYSEYAMGYTNNPYGSFGEIKYYIDQKVGTGGFSFANLNAFRNTLMDFIELAYNEAWGKSADSVASMFVSEPINKLLKGSYSSRLYKLMKENAEASVKKVSLHCPVDVYVYGSNGNLCGSVVNDSVTLMNDIYINLSWIGNECMKDFYLSGDDYTIKIIGRAKGSMDYGITEYQKGEKVASYYKSSISILYGKTYDALIPATIGIDPSVYSLNGGYGEIVPITTESEEKAEDPLIYDCGDNAIIIIDTDNKTATIRGTGPMWDFYHSLLLDESAIRYVIVEEGITYIGRNAFAAQMTFPDESGFNGETDITSDRLVTVEIADSVTEIGERAFAGQRSLASISIGKGLQKIGINALLDCNRLRNIYVDPSNECFFADSDQVLYSRDKKILYKIPFGMERYEGPKGLEMIREFAAAKISSLRSIVIPETVRFCGSGAFWKCEALTKVAFMPKNLTHNDECYGGSVKVFQDCDAIQTIGPIGSGSDVELSMESVSGSLFRNMRGLKTVILQDGVNSIESTMLENCPELDYVRIPGTIEWMGEAFEKCDKLKTCGPIGGGFNIEFGWKEKIPMEALRYVDSLDTLVIPEGITHLGSDAFMSCSNLEKVILPKSLTVREEVDQYYGGTQYLFHECPKLLTVGPKGGDYNIEICWDTEIPKGFFEYSTIESIVIPTGVRTIKELAFYCSSIKKVTFPASIDSIEFAAFAYTGINEAVLSGSSEELELSDSSFEECGLKKISLPVKMKKIGNEAFQKCDELETVVMPNLLNELDSYAFNGCKSLRNITVPEGIKKLEQGVFNDCTSLERIEIPDSVTEIAGAFSGCSALKSVDIPESVSIMTGRTFEDCCSLEDVKIPSAISRLNGSTFRNCTSLKKIFIPEGIRFVSSFDFENCTSLEEVSFYNNTTFARNAFEGCTSIKSVYFYGFKDEWEKKDFSNNEPLANAEVHFMDFKRNLSDAFVTGLYTYVYSGEPIVQDPKVIMGARTLIKDVDYTLSYLNNINAGTATLIVTGIGTYEGTINSDFIIRKANQIIDVELPFWNIKEGEKTILSVTGEKGNLTFSSSDERIATVDSSGLITAKEPGQVKIIVAASETSNYNAFSATVHIRVDSVSTNIALSTIGGITGKTFTGHAVTQIPVVRIGSTVLKLNTDYKVSYKNNINAGTATVIITGKGNYTGTKTATFKINKASLTKSTVTLPSSKVWTGWALTPVPTVKLGGKTLKKGTDFTLAFKNNKNVGTATITITGKGNYAGTIKKTFRINPKPTSVSKITAGSKKLTVTWKKQASQTTGYQIQYSSRSDFKTQKIVTVTGVSKVSTVLKGLAAKHKYYVRVRIFKTVSGKKYYSTWSAAKSAKTK